MASISSDGNGKRRIQFVDTDGSRKTIYLKVPQRLAEQIKLKVEHLLAAKASGLPLDNETAVWVRDLGDDLASKLAAVGLIPERAVTTLGMFLDSYIEGRGDVKSGTRTNYRISRDRLLAFFDPATKLRDITEGDVDSWVVFLRQRYAQPTVSRTIKHARQFFKSALRKKLIGSNPFTDVKAGTQTNMTRAFFVTREMADKILAACTDDEWRLIFVLSRYAGLRCPSEHLNLQWEDIDWQHDKMLIRAPKKEHLDDGGERWVPIFPEVKPYLERAFDNAEEGATNVITRYRAANQNLRTRMMKTIRRAGLKVWPRIFQNLRSSCETELAQNYPLHVVCEWIGNSAKVAADHYLQVVDTDYERGAKYGALGAQNTAQHASARYSTEKHSSPQPQCEPEVMPNCASPCCSIQAHSVTPTGFEPVSQP